MNATDIASLPADFWLKIVRRKASAMRYGSLEIVVQDGNVTFVEATEKSRLPVQESERVPARRA
jgi:hypothetical protein